MIKLLDKALSRVLALLMTLMVTDVVWQVFSRFATDTPSSWTEELARFLLIWIGFLGATWAYRMRAHLGLSYLVEKQTPATQKRLAIFSHLATALFAILVMIYGGSQLVFLTLELNQLSPSLDIKIGYVYVIIPISGILITVYALDFTRAGLTGETYIAPHLEEDTTNIAAGD